MKAPFLRNRRQQLFAWGMAKANMVDADRIRLKHCRDFTSMGELKRSVLGHLQGTVAEIGPGAGANLGYYSRGIHWIGIEPNPFMHPYIHREAERCGLQNVEIRGGQAERLPLEDGSVDAVVSTYVLCSVADIEATLKEIQRVLRPGGSFVFVEHVAAPEGTCTRNAQEALTPLWQAVFDGCHPSRETWMQLEKAGFASARIQFFRLSLPIVSPHIAGVATR